MTLPQNVKQDHHFVGMDQKYRDLFVRHNEMLYSLTNLVGEFGHTKATKAGKTRKEQWYWDSVHLTTFDNVKTTTTNNIFQANPDYPQEIEVYTDSSKSQLGVVITKTTCHWHFLAGT